MTSLRSFFQLALMAFCGLALDAVAANESFKVSEFTFQRPVEWKWVQPSSSMRKAELAVPAGSHPEGAEVVFFYFGTQGAGGVEANVSRWLGQFSEPRTEANTQVDRKTVNGFRIHYVQTEGTYQSGSPFGPKTSKAGFAMLGAIVEGKEGPVYIKMTGPKPLVMQSHQILKKLVEDALN